MTVGMATTDGVYIDGNLSVKGDLTGPAAAQMVLRDPTVDGAEYEAVSVVVANGRYYAGDYMLAPDARLAEPRLHVCLFEKAGRAAAFRYALATQQGELTDLPDYRVVTGRKVRIEGPDGDPVQVDGDIVAALPVEIEAVPDALRLVMPAAG